MTEETDRFLEGGCTEDRKKKCWERSGPNLPVLCASCEKKDYEPDPYVSLLYRLYSLQEAGFPLDADACDLDTWHDLAMLRTKIMARSFSTDQLVTKKVSSPRASHNNQ